MKKNIGLGLFATLCIAAGLIIWTSKNTPEGKNNAAHLETSDAPSPRIELSPDLSSSQTPALTATSMATIGTREFSVTPQGDFEHYGCKGLEETIEELPDNRDIIVTAGSEKPFEVFRLDIIAQTLKAQNLPFIVWEEVPVKDRPRAHFSTIATLDFAKVDDKFVATPMLRDRQIMERISYERAVDLYPEFVSGSEKMPVRTYRLSDVHSLIEVQGYFGLADYDETTFQDWTKGYSPFLGGASLIQGPFITLKHPPENEQSEGAIASNLLDQRGALLNIFRDDQFLYAVTIQDNIQYKKEVKLKVTRFDPSQFAQVVINGDRADLSNQKYSKPPQGEALELCALTLTLQ